MKFDLTSDKTLASSSMATKYQRVATTNQEKKGFSSQAKRFSTQLRPVGDLTLLTLDVNEKSKMLNGVVVMCLCFRMKTQDRAATAVSPLLKLIVRPSQRKAPQALWRPRSGTLLLIYFYWPKVIKTRRSSLSSWNSPGWHKVFKCLNSHRRKTRGDSQS